MAALDDEAALPQGEYTEGAEHDEADDAAAPLRVRGNTELRRNEASPDAVRERCAYYVQFTSEHDPEPAPMDPTKVREGDVRIHKGWSGRRMQRSMLILCSPTPLPPLILIGRRRVLPVTPPRHLGRLFDRPSQIKRKKNGKVKKNKGYRGPYNIMQVRLSMIIEPPHRPTHPTHPTHPTLPATWYLRTPLQAYARLPLASALLTEQIDGCNHRKPGSDFTVSRVVRLAGVITAIPEAERPEGYTEALEQILGGFRKYRFWPTDAGRDEMIFWSEVRATTHQHYHDYATTTPPPTPPPPPPSPPPAA